MHRYGRPEWSDEKNRATFGAASERHGHDYICEVTVSGDIDPLTGMIVDLGALDRALDAEIRERFDGKDINRDVTEFGDAGLVPTCENLARFILERTQLALGASVRVARVVVREDETLSAAYDASPAS